MSQETEVAAGRRLPILCLDFDGVIHAYTSGWQGADQIPDPPVAGAIAFLYEAIQHFEVHIFSTRSSQIGGLNAMRTWLWLHDCNWRAEQSRAGRPLLRTHLTMQVQFPTTKPPAHVSLDDRGLLFTGTWPAMDTLVAFKPWYQS